MASAPPCSGRRYKTFGARKALVEMNDYPASGGLLKLIQVNLACVFENGTRARVLVLRSHHGDEKFTRLDPRLILERFIFLKGRWL
jgi:hypothetical protein